MSQGKHSSPDSNRTHPDGHIYIFVHIEQEFGISEEGSFRTGPAPSSDETVKLLAIADLGFCEEDGSMTYAGNYPNPIATLPVGTPAEIKQEVGVSNIHCTPMATEKGA